MLKLHKIRSKSRGDTIVEVMVVLAILGLAVSISYATASKSLLDTSESEENSQATEFAQAEVEDVRYLAPTSTNDLANPNYSQNGNIFRPAVAFCIPSPTAAAPIVNATAANCNFGAIPYHIVVYNCDYFAAAPCANIVNAPHLSDSFIVVASWPNVAGNATDTVTMTYRIHSP